MGKDVNDPDRPGMILEHVPFYYNRYFKKSLMPKFYGCDTMKQVLSFARDTVMATGQHQIVEPLLPEELEYMNIFVMLAEEGRRERNRRVDLGDESFRLKFTVPSAAATQKAAPPTMSPPAGAPQQTPMIAPKK